MILNAQTVWLIAGASAGTMGLLLWLQYVVIRDEVAMALWGIGKLLLATGAILIGLRDSVPDFWSVLGGNGLVTLGWTVMLIGSLTFNGTRINVAWAAVPFLVQTVAMATLTPFAVEDAPERATIINVVVGIVICGTAADCFRAQHHEHLFWRRVQIIVLFGWIFGLMLRSSMGLRVPDSANPLADTALQVGTVTILMILSITNGVVCMMMSRERVDQALRLAAMRDAQTALFNRTGLEQHWAELAKRRVSVVVMLFDIDGFKVVNDTQGHVGGDIALTAFATTVERHLGPGDIAARYGGDEFCVLLAHRSLDDGAALADRIRAEYAESSSAVIEGEPVSITVSAGVCRAETSAATVQDAIVRADTALYRAKSAGRNRIEVT